jgi:hypothetical protein
MSNLALFAVGVVVTAIVALGLGLLVYGAILDGRDEAERRALDNERVVPLFTGGRESAA